jgi:cob(I)alamin adenosyltransferase
MTIWRGDRGYSDLIDQQEIPKDDLRFDVLGTLDEASAALGLARALSTAPEGKTLVLQVQQDLCWMMSELASQSPTPDRRYITAEHTARLEERMRAAEAQVPRPTTFVAAGDSLSGAAMQLARTIVRRAERLVVQLDREGQLHNPEIVAYLNHLSAYLYALARYEDVATDIHAQRPTLLRPPPRTASLIQMEEPNGRLENTA